jgi:hypothetical protein
MHALQSCRQGDRRTKAYDGDKSPALSHMAILGVDIGGLSSNSMPFCAVQARPPQIY